MNLLNYLLLICFLSFTNKLNASNINELNDVKKDHSTKLESAKNDQTGLFIRDERCFRVDILNSKTVLEDEWIFIENFKSIAVDSILHENDSVLDFARIYTEEEKDESNDFIRESLNHYSKNRNLADLSLYKKKNPLLKKSEVLNKALKEKSEVLNNSLKEKNQD